MDIRPIRSDEDLTWALRRIDALWNAEAGSPEGDELDVLATLVVRYEHEHYPIARASPLEHIRFSMEQNGRSQADFARLLGSRSRASEILAGKREMTLDQIRKVSKAWRIPISLLVGELQDA
jgi:HTH-type transcriptional regulator/antitoxin HigA